MSKNKLIVAAAGAGKTTYIVNEALKQEGAVLITTYTDANEEEIKRKIQKINGSIPANITVQTWFSFLLQHGIKPYQGCMTDKKINGLFFVQSQSGTFKDIKTGQTIYYSEDKHFDKYYFSKDFKIYSDKLSKFAIRCNEKSNSNVIDRLSRIYPNIYVDEVQDLAGYDLDVLKLLFQSQSSVVLVGDPRQVTYLTHHEKRHSQYKNGRIEEFIIAECKKLDCEIDTTTLKYSHRNTAAICNFSSRLYPGYPQSEACNCNECRPLVTNHNGIYLVKGADVGKYIKTFRPTILRYSEAQDFEWTFGKSKGLGFERTLIYPPKTFIKYLQDGVLTKENNKGKIVNTFDISKLYVALTRAVYSAGIVCDYSGEDKFIEGVNLYLPVDLALN